MSVSGKLTRFPPPSLVRAVYLGGGRQTTEHFWEKMENTSDGWNLMPSRRKGARSRIRSSKQLSNVLHVFSLVVRWHEIQE